MQDINHYFNITNHNILILLITINFL